MDLLQNKNGDAADWLFGGGEMGDLIRAFDWSATTLGPRASWPQSLRLAVRHKSVSIEKTGPSGFNRVDCLGLLDVC